MTPFARYLADFFTRPNAPTQRAVAERSEINTVTLNRIVRGHTVPSLATAEAIALATGSSLGRILRKLEKQKPLSD